MRCIRNVVAPIIIALAWLGAAQAQPSVQLPSEQQPRLGGGSSSSVMRGPNPEITVQILRQAGYTDVEIFNAKSGDQERPQVRAKVNGMTVLAWHYTCENSVCRSLQFIANFGPQESIDLNWINAWNREKRFSKVTKNKRGAVSLEMDIHFYGGTTAAFIQESAKLFAELLKQVLDFKPSS